MFATSAASSRAARLAARSSRTSTRSADSPASPRLARRGEPAVAVEDHVRGPAQGRLLARVHRQEGLAPHHRQRLDLPRGP
ncbi:hypothetical protein [Streptomyces katrae]|uniref:hypothetical protein n=1 Tax=Streptomyces katrae TaxID=68223 RepID=UPI0006982DE0|nr:hypothetical protein [Streptomyces katrae]